MFAPRNHVAAIAAASFSLGWATAHTGEAADQPATLEEIVVTAERHAANVQDIPIAMTATQGVYSLSIHAVAYDLAHAVTAKVSNGTTSI